MSNVLPEYCYAKKPSTGEVIKIRKGESGYYPVLADVNCDELNAILGVTKGQAEAMLVGSMFGWNIPGANPDMYNDDGDIIMEKVKTMKELDLTWFVDTKTEVEHDAVVDYIQNNLEGDEFLICDFYGRERAVKDEIRESLWDFNAEFILEHSNVGDVSDKVISAFRKMQDKLCESANELVFALISDFDDFVNDAVDSDGFGHFLSRYDGCEHIFKIGDSKFYIYRNN